MAKMKIRPLDDRVVVEPIEAEERTAGGIVLPDTAKEKPQRGTVVAVGPGRLLDSGDRASLSVAVGDEVIYGKYGGTDIKVNGDPEKAPPAFRPLADLLQHLLRFDHPILRPFTPAQLRMQAHEATRPGGCRLWTLLPTPTEAAAGTTLSSATASSWVPGVATTSVCVGDKRYEVQLRPLVPGE